MIYEAQSFLVEPDHNFSFEKTAFFFFGLFDLKFYFIVALSIKRTYQSIIGLNICEIKLKMRDVSICAR